MPNNAVRRLRLHLFTGFGRRQSSFQNRAFSCSSTPLRSDAIPNDRHDGRSTHDYKQRIAQLETHSSRESWYPRLADSPVHTRVSLKEFRDLFSYLDPGMTNAELSHTVTGKIQSIRASGAKLSFITVENSDGTLQIVINHAELIRAGVDTTQLRPFLSTARKGDSFSFSGRPHRTQRGQLSLLATHIPILLSPSLHQIPERLDDAETISHHRHVDMLVHPQIQQTLRIRHVLEQTVDNFLSSRDFVKVSTPILQSGAGGAVARPFETEATELQGKQLHLRIAPELFLKRLIIGGMSRVYEMGPVFRNEGVDTTHNPEFTICEFYAAHATLNELIQWTEELVTALADAVDSKAPTSSTNTLSYLRLESPFPRLEFIPALESAIGLTLPDLMSPTAIEDLKAIFATKGITLPTKPSLPRLLDALASHYLDPLCQQPTFITHHPAALSPLSKHFRCSATNQLISARAELFINHREIANMYEEQNSPFAQRQAFIEQLHYRSIDGESDGRTEVDEAYLEALEWGLPPTGGWGCGIDRLVMLFAGRDRLGDVLSFGGLRNVVGISRGREGVSRTQKRTGETGHSEESVQ